MTAYPPQNNPSIEGNFNVWTKQWQKNVPTDYGINAWGAQRIQVNENTNRILMWRGSGPTRIIAVLSTGVIVGVSVDSKATGGADGDGTPGTMFRYFAEIIDTGATYNLVIFKDGVAVQTTDLIAAFAVGYVAGQFWALAFDPTGKYLVVTGPHYGAVDANLTCGLYKGA